MAEYIEPLPYPFTMIEWHGKVNPALKEPDREQEWGEILRAIERMGLWPHTRETGNHTPEPGPNTPAANKARLNAIRAIESPRASYSPRNRGAINK